MELPMHVTSTRTTMPGGMWKWWDKMSFTPTKTKTADTPYLSRENICTKTSMMKNVARKPSIAKTAEV